MQLQKIRVTTIIILFLICALAGFTSFAMQTPSGSSTDDWPLFHHDSAHTGVTTETGPADPVKLWSYAEGGLDNVFISSSATVADGVVYVGFNYNETDGSGVGIYAFDACTGTKLWNYSTVPWDVYVTPAISNNMLFVGVAGGSFYALNALTGAKVWNTTIFATFSSPTITNDVVYVGSMDRNVYALNASSGEHLWNYTTRDRVASSPAVCEGVVYVGSDDNNVYALDASTGAKVWNYSTSSIVHSSPAVSNGIVYAGSMDGSVYALNCSTGEKIWSRQISAYTGSWYQQGVQASPAIANGVVYIGSYDGDFYALDALTGISLWSNPALHTGVCSAVTSGQTVYIGANNTLYALHASNGSIIWSFPTGGPLKSSPTISKGILYIISQDGYLYAIGSLSNKQTSTTISFTVLGILLLSILLFIIVVTIIAWKKIWAKKTRSSE